MDIQINTDSNVNVNELHSERIEAELTDALARFARRLTRIEVHLSNESAGRSTGEDFRCLIETRPPGVAPIVVMHHGSTLTEALGGAIDRIEARLTSTFERHEGHGTRATIRGR